MTPEEASKPLGLGSVDDKLWPLRYGIIDEVRTGFKLKGSMIGSWRPTRCSAGDRHEILAATEEAGEA